MRDLLPAGTAALCLALTACAAAAPSNSAFATAPNARALALYPVQIDTETARYVHGQATIHRESAVGTVELRPLAVRQSDRIAFEIAYLNASTAPANFGIANIAAQVDGIPLTLPSAGQLARDEQRKTRSRQIGAALVTGVVAGVASTASNEATYHQRVRTPHGVYARTVHVEDNTPGVLGAGAALVGGALVVKGMEDQLDRTLAGITGRMLEMTTVDPGASVGGMVVVPLPDRGPLPRQITVQVRSNGAVYAFALRLTAEGQNVPPPLPATGREQGLAVPSGPKPSTAPAP